MYRLAHLLAAEDGPWELVARLRRAAGQGMFGRLLDCPYCLSLWLAIPFAVLRGDSAGEQALLWLGLSGGSVALERLTRRGDVPPAPYFESEEEVPDVMLRK